MAVTFVDTLDGEESQALTEDTRGAHAEEQHSDPKVALAFKVSWVVNIGLLLAKLVAFLATGSMSVLAALADSAVDVASQVVIAIAEYLMTRASDSYPVGRSRLEALGVLGCAAIMSMTSLEVIRSSSVGLYQGLKHDNVPELEVGPLVYTILGGGTLFKAALWLFCRQYAAQSDSIGALAEDHLNDVMSNSLAIVTMTVAAVVVRFWWCDPLGAILISLVIIFRWTTIISEQVQKVVGAAAPAEFVAEIAALCRAHDTRIKVDCIRAYHFGSRFNVEVEVILPGDLTLVESHDVGLALQDKIECLDTVERAFVHMDYRERHRPEHKTERSILNLQALENTKRRRRRFSGKTWAKVAFLFAGQGQAQGHAGAGRGREPGRGLGSEESTLDNC